MKRIIYITFLISYIIGIFLLTVYGRIISNYLRSMNVLNYTIAFMFCFIFIISICYIFFVRRLFGIKTILQFIFITSLLIYMIVHIRQPEARFHLIEYGILALLLIHVLSNLTIVVKKYIIAILLSFTIGLMDEFVQLYLPDRFFDVSDILINAGSAVIFVMYYAIINKKQVLLK